MWGCREKEDRLQGHYRPKENFSFFHFFGIQQTIREREKKKSYHICVKSTHQTCENTCSPFFFFCTHSLTHIFSMQLTLQKSADSHNKMQNNSVKSRCRSFEFIVTFYFYFFFATRDCLYPIKFNLNSYMEGRGSLKFFGFFLYLLQYKQRVIISDFLSFIFRFIFFLDCFSFYIYHLSHLLVSFTLL